MQHESSCTNIHNKVNMLAYSINFYPSDSRNKKFDRESSPTLRKLADCVGTNIETDLNSSLSAVQELRHCFDGIELLSKFKCYGLDLLMLFNSIQFNSMQWFIRTILCNVHIIYVRVTIQCINK